MHAKHTREGQLPTGGKEGLELLMWCWTRQDLGISRSPTASRAELGLFQALLGMAAREKREKCKHKVTFAWSSPAEQPAGFAEDLRTSATSPCPEVLWPLVLALDGLLGAAHHGAQSFTPPWWLLCQGPLL